ncbi:mediator complex, subunit Med21 [Halenospora varia]|nr:mediator complex, subunit Med21 [Halenospora varia]
MADRLTQLQDAVDQLANQFIASIYYVNRHHNLQAVSATDTVRNDKKADDPTPADQDVDALPLDQFKAQQRELAQDLILKEQQIEFLISILPGLENSEKDQEETIKQLERELQVAEAERKQALKEKEEVLARLEGVIRSVKRP